MMMKSTRQFDSYEQFAREELRCNRTADWSLDDLTDEFLACADLDLNLIEGDAEPEDEEDDD